MNPTGVTVNRDQVATSRPANANKTTAATRSEPRTSQAYTHVRAPNAALKPRKIQPQVSCSSRSIGSGAAPRGRSRIAARAGESVRELIADSSVDTAMVRANCRKNCPTMPAMKLHGTNTAVSTRATPITGPVTSCIALNDASRGESPCSIHRSTFSTTTIASSTTMPIASTSPNSERLLRLKPRAAMKAKVPTIATGTATSGMSVARQFCRKSSTTRATKRIASRSVLSTSAFDSSMKGVVS